MLKSHVKFHSANGKRQIMIADDEMINREILRAILESDYEVIFAEDGAQALQKTWDNRDTLSLVLLDLMMPAVPGMEVLRKMKENPETAHIPVIVMTSDQTAEVECLGLGAIDFISKPYPQAGVVAARVLRTIELSEDRDIIQSTERDPLTGLYNKEFFYRYAEQYDNFHKDRAMDAVVIDINHFHILNERYGKAYADEVLKKIGSTAVGMVGPDGGIVCRREADTFLVYCPHREDYSDFFQCASKSFEGEDRSRGRVRLRMGVYSCADKAIDIERRFDRAKIAADTVRGSFGGAIGTYDDAMHESEMYTEQLIEDFHRAINERQFVVYYQPKFDIRPDIPVLNSAEALVRWDHPELGMISPGVFIPLFEENGLIQELDMYVWREAARQIAGWREKFGFAVPVSVNVSRIDMYDPGLVETFLQILEENGISTGDLYLEITESAYTQDSEQIINTVNELRLLGFKIEMDDFGTGYSSLNMISNLPIDALKLDMKFIRTAFSGRRDTRMLEVIIDIADYLQVPVIAEGVETEEQLFALKAMGCDIVQGYYFSRPIPVDEYESFVRERASLGRIEEAEKEEEKKTPRKKTRDESDFATIAHALSSGFESIYYVDVENGHYVEFSAEGRYEDLQIKRSGADFFSDIRDSIEKNIYPEDQLRVSLFLEKETLISQLIGSQPFSMTYRLMVGGEPTSYTTKAVRARTHDNHHIVVGMTGVDEEMMLGNRPGQEPDITGHASGRDALTGVKSLQAFVQAQEVMNQRLAAGERPECAVVVFDVNGLKKINEAYGRKAGDEFIRSACSVICNTFKRSPVFRVGGDEFAAILEGQDFNNREALLKKMDEVDRWHADAGRVVIARGMAELRPGEDLQLQSVCDRAGAAMYENKKTLKGET